MAKTNWKTEDLQQIYRLRKNKKDWIEIAKKISGKTPAAIKRKYSRMDWQNFLKDPQDYIRDTFKKWTSEDMAQLDAYLQTGQSYDFIAEKLNRSLIAVERRAQETDWKAWREVKGVASDKEEVLEDNKEKLLCQFTNALLMVCRNDFKRLNDIKEKDFLEKVNLDKSRLFVSFSNLKNNAKEELIKLGFGNSENIEFGSGTYVVVGDSHGKHTKTEMFSLLKEINKNLNPKKIIHIGHILDDDNDISYQWEYFNNLVILAKAEELKIIQEQRNKFKFNYEIVRESVDLGDLAIVNQDMISDYVRTPISNLGTELFEDFSANVIVNCHRLEFATRCTNVDSSFLASPGCLCEEHIVSTIKQIDFEYGQVTKQAYHEGFSKYRRMRHMNQYWEQGVIVVQVGKDGSHTVIPCPIKKTPKGYTISYFDKIITSTGLFNPDMKIFVNGDMHCDKHDIRVLEIQEQICKDYKPDVQVNVGDTFNYSSLNHHVMDRGGVIMDKKILDEAAQTHFVLKRVSKWAKESHLIYGNHERFAKDFVEKYPQFGKYLDFKFICGVDGLGYKLTNLKSVLKIGSVKFVHGEIRMYGQAGSKLEKASRVFGRDVYIGHIHRPEIRFGCYSVGLSGLIDQDYNEPESSNWLAGFGMCNQFKGISFPTSIAIINNQCMINNKIYKPQNLDSWKMSKYDVKLAYDF